MKPRAIIASVTAGILLIFTVEAQEITASIRNGYFHTLIQENQFENPGKTGAMNYSIAAEFAYHPSNFSFAFGIGFSSLDYSISIPVDGTSRASARISNINFKTIKIRRTRHRFVTVPIGARYHFPKNKQFYLPLGFTLFKNIQDETDFYQSIFVGVNTGFGFQIPILSKSYISLEPNCQLIYNAKKDLFQMEMPSFQVSFQQSKRLIFAYGLTLSIGTSL
ncbi:MAG: hypothetical protein AAF789_07250 [Bacteroidota bacterium]